MKLNRDHLQQLARVRLREAQLLLEASEWSGAYYLAGYVVEYALKACIAKRTERYDFPDKQLALESYVHDFRKLVITGQLTSQLKSARENDPIFETNWRLVVNCSEQDRYQFFSRTDSQAMIKAVQDERHGVLQWIMHYW